MIQPGLFDAPRARSDDPATSHAAAQRVAGRAMTLRQCIVDLLRASPDGLTERECSEIIGGDRTSISPRFRELERAGAIVRAGVKDNRTLWRST